MALLCSSRDAWVCLQLYLPRARGFSGEPHRAELTAQGWTDRWLDWGKRQGTTKGIVYANQAVRSTFILKAALI